MLAHKNSIIALIPARGGSKRIPNKNIKDFNGKPIIYYSITCAKNANIFDRIIVSTDSQEIASIAKNLGAEIPFIRPPEISQDNSTTDEVIIHAINTLENYGEKITYICCIYPTAPMLQPEYLKQGLTLLKEKNAQTAISITSFPSNIFRAFKYNPENSRIAMFWPENRLKRSQDLPEAFHDAAQFYWINVEHYKKDPRLFSENSYGIKIPRYLVQDIDSEEDWNRAELMYKAYKNAF